MGSLLFLWIWLLAGKFRFIGRDGPAADSLRTLAVDVRILIVLDFKCISNFDLSGRRTVENVGAINDRPVILRSKMTSPKAKPHYFPSGNPKLLRNLGGRSMIAPTVSNEQINRNLKCT